MKNVLVSDKESRAGKFSLKKKLAHVTLHKIEISKTNTSEAQKVIRRKIILPKNFCHSLHGTALTSNELKNFRVSNNCQFINHNFHHQRLRTTTDEDDRQKN